MVPNSIGTLGQESRQCACECAIHVYNGAECSVDVKRWGGLPEAKLSEDASLRAWESLKLSRKRESTQMKRTACILSRTSWTSERHTEPLSIDKIGEDKCASVSRYNSERLDRSLDPRKIAQRKRFYRVALCVLSKCKALAA
eukprot:IDg14045t1